MAFNAKRFIKLLNTQRWDSIAKFLHKEAVFTDPFCPDPVRGIDTILKIMEENLSILPNSDYELLDSFGDERRRVLELERSGSTIVWDGQPYSTSYKLPMVVLLDFMEGKISSYRGYFDMGYLLRKLEESVRSSKPAHT